MMLQALMTAIYKVGDLAAAKTWYSRALGVEPYFDEPFYVGFHVAGYELGLDPDLSDAQPGPGGQIAYWGVSDIETAVRHLLSIGAQERGGIRDVGGDIHVAVVGDPFGNALGLIHNPNFNAH